MKEEKLVKEDEKFVFFSKMVRSGFTKMEKRSHVRRKAAVEQTIFISYK